MSGVCIGWCLRLTAGRKGFLAVFGLVCGLMINVLTIPLYKRSCDEGILGQMTFGLKSRYIPNIGGLKLYQDEYEPRIVTRDPNEIAVKMKNQKKVVRPRFYSTELGIKEKLVVAVMSTPSVLQQLGETLNTTLSQHVDKLLMFSNAPYFASHNNRKMDVISFTDRSPSQFYLQVIKYLNTNYAEGYSFFFLVNAMESVPYINGRALQRMVSHVSVSHTFYMGVPHETERQYCVTEKGVLLSTSLLSALSSSAEWCDTSSGEANSIDSKLGQCVKHAMGLTCTTTIQEKVYRSVGLPGTASGTSGDVLDSLHALNIPNNRTLMPYTVTGIKDRIQLASVHHFFLTKEIQILKDFVNETQEEILRVRPKANLLPREHTWPIGSPTPHHPTSRFDVIMWTGFNATHVFMPDEQTNVAPLADALLRDVTSVVVAAASHITNRTEGQLQVQKLNYGYYKVDPLRGTDYILSLMFKNVHTEETVEKVMEASRSITNPEFVQFPIEQQKSNLFIVVRIPQEDINKAHDFVDRYLAVKGLPSLSDLVLVVEVPEYSTNSQETEVYNLRWSCDRKATVQRAKIKVLSVAPPSEESGSGMSLVSFMDKVIPQLPSEALVAVLSVHSRIYTEFIDRVKHNTISGWQIFSPMVWGVFHPKTQTPTSKSDADNLAIKRDIGHFKRFDYTAISFFSSDYVAARAAAVGVFPRDQFTRSTPPLSIYRLFLSFSNLHVLRAPEPDLRLPYVPVTCPSHVDIDNPTVVDTSHFSTPNELSDLSQLMGDSLSNSNAAFYRYIEKHYWSEMRGDKQKQIQWRQEDFNSDALCVENLLHSFGTRAQLGKISMEYHNSDKIKPAVPIM